jgi:glycerate kinase
MSADRARLTVIVAPDKFKGTFTAPEVAAALAAGVRSAAPDAVVQQFPVGDGGEGTLDALIASGWTRHWSETISALGAPMRTSWGSRDGIAYIELAAASGCGSSRRTVSAAAAASTRGTGRLVRAALDAGFRTILIGLGGSATTDGGLGLLRELGVEALDDADRPVEDGGGALASVARVELGGIDPRLRESTVTAVCDVHVPLLGPHGAARAFGEQKGADADLVERLEIGLAQYAQRLAEATGRDARTIEWGGAAGGTSAGLYSALNASVVSGADYVIDAVGLRARLGAADLVFVGEGSMDRQSLSGKAPIGVARAAAARGVPVVAVVGTLSADQSALRRNGVADVVVAAPPGVAADRHDLTRAAELATARALDRPTGQGTDDASVGVIR